METQSGIDEKTYRAIVSIVDRRMKEIRVTRKDFDALTSAITELAEAQKRTEKRIEELAEAQKKTDERLSSLALKVEELAEAQKKTEQRVEELAEAQKRTDERLSFLASKVEALAEAQKRTENKLERLEGAVETLAHELKNLAREVGALAENVGFGLEDIAHVVLPGYLYRHLRIEMGEFERRFFTVDGEEVEINLYAEGKMNGEKVVILGEVKSRIFAREVEKFQEVLSKVLPTISERVVKVMFGYFFRPEASELAKKFDIIPVVSYQR